MSHLSFFVPTLLRLKVLSYCCILRWNEAFIFTYRTSAALKQSLQLILLISFLAPRCGYRIQIMQIQKVNAYDITSSVHRTTTWAIMILFRINRHETSNKKEVLWSFLNESCMTNVLLLWTLFHLTQSKWHRQPRPRQYYIFVSRIFSNTN